MSPTPIDAVRRSAQPLRGDAHDHDALLALIGDARFVLLGEATHGTHDPYDVEAAFDAMQNARLVHNAEAHYRATVFGGDESSWNRRDRHMAETLAATDWDGPHERKTVQPSRADSYERLLHATGLPRLMLPLRDAAQAQQALMAPRRERAIGVIYRPERELHSHYFHACLPRQFDAVVHIDTTSAVRPLDAHEQPALREAAETYPSGL